MCLATLIWSDNTEVSPAGRTSLLLLAVPATKAAALPMQDLQGDIYRLLGVRLCIFCFLHGRLLTQATDC